LKVLHLTAGNLFGGVETYLLALARLRPLCPEMEPHFGVCFPGRCKDELTLTGVGVHDLGMVRLSRPWTVLRARWRLKRLLRTLGVEVVATHGMWPHAVFAPTVRKARLRLVNFVHGTLDNRNRIDRWAARTPPDVVVTNSQFTATSARAMFARVPMAVVHPPVPVPRLGNDTARERLRAEFDTPSETVVILTVSRIEELKGYAVLIDALGQLRDLPGWACWVVGAAQRLHEVELVAKLKATIDRLGMAARVRFLGARSDVPQVMGGADIYCQPNTGGEGFGLTFVEAMHARLPVVTSRIGGAVEIVTEACGRLCPPGDAGAVAGALRELIGNAGLRRRLGEAGPARATELCDPTRQLRALHLTLLGNDRT